MIKNILLQKKLLKGLTLMEVIVSTIIIALTVAGMASLFMGGKRWVLHSRTRMVGGELGRVFLDPLQMDVNQSQWSGGDYTGTNRLRTCIPPDLLCDGPSPTINGRPYQSQYTVTTVPGDPTSGNQMRKVIVNITWPATVDRP